MRPLHGPMLAAGARGGGRARGGADRRTRPARSSCPPLSPALLRRVADRLEAVDIPVAEIGLRLPSLDDVFLALTGHGAEEAA